MGNNSFRANYQRGLLPLIILSLLSREDMYGYQLVQETEKNSGGRIVTQEGSLYPVLYKLEEGGFISSRKVLVGKRMSRVYYHIEPVGKEYLAALIREYQAVGLGMASIINDCEDKK